MVITAMWITAQFVGIARLLYDLIGGTEYYQSSRWGSCIRHNSILLALITTVIPIIVTVSITLTLDIYLSIKAYQIYKRIQKDSGEEVQVFKDKLNKVLEQLKPVITLLVTILGSTAMSVIASILYVSTLTVEDESYVMFINHILIPLFSNFTVILHTLVYGLYFREIRQPLCKRFKCIVQSCKFNKKMNSISPS